MGVLADMWATSYDADAAVLANVSVNAFAHVNTDFKFFLSALLEEEAIPFSCVAFSCCSIVAS